MNRIAYRMTGLAIKAVANISNARIRVHGKENIPPAPAIFVVNHFTRLETLLLPYHIFRLTGVPVWSLADYKFFKGSMGTFLNQVGAVSTKDPDRDRLVVKTLLTGEAMWIIFPEGRMVKNKKIVEKGRYMVSYAGGKHPPHTGAATLALRTEFYRERLRGLIDRDPAEADRLLGRFQIASVQPLLEKTTVIVPVNVTYYPMRARGNILSELAAMLWDDLPERLQEEIQVEGNMLLSGVDMDIRFGAPIPIHPLLAHAAIERDIAAKAPIDFDDPIRSKPLMHRMALKVMKRYMAAIYGLTTVNYDHLQAAILRQMPTRTIDPQDFRGRVFLAATQNFQQMGLWTHDHLARGQIQLLHGSGEDACTKFLTQAADKGLVVRQGRLLIKDRSKLSAVLDFNRARVDNPIAVIANEIEPLAALQRSIRRIAWMPAFWVRRTIARHLLQREKSEFEADYRRFARQGESHDLQVGMPFLVTGRSRAIGVVLIHGYLAAPLEVSEIADYLKGRGVWVYAPRLKGHGTSPEDLARRTYADWVTSVETGYGLLRNICRRVVVGGFSTGAGLALELTSRVKEVAGVFAVCPPLQLQDFSSRFAPAVDTWNRLMNRVRLDGAKMEFVENASENPHINYPRNPIAGVRELERLMEDLEPRLPGVRAPALIVQSVGDPVVDPRGSRRLFERLGSVDKQYTLFNLDRHGILLGEGASQVHRAIGDFVDRLR